MYRKMLFLFKILNSSLNKKRIIEDLAYKYDASKLSLWGVNLLFHPLKKKPNQQQPSSLNLRREPQGLLNGFPTSIQAGSSQI